MGAIAGILHWDDRPIDRRDLERVVQASPYRAPDGVARSIGERTALAHLRFLTTDPEADGQPFIDSARGLAFVFDGRLDNRDDLSGLLQVGPDAPDARIAFEAFAHWREDAARHLLGDFAFIGWDERERRAICARDHMGMRHLHYFAAPGMLVCATDVAQVMAHPRVPREPNPEVAADYLAIEIRNGPGTLYRHVHRVPPGHTLIAGPQGTKLVRYWAPEPGTPVRHATDDGYADECRDLLIRSVSARMRSNRPVAAMLSGGLDSSSVVTVAHRLVPSAGPPPRPFSMIYPDHPESDERPFIDAVARACGTDSVLVRPGPVTGDALRRRARQWSDAPGMPADESAMTLWRAMRAHDHRATLTGAGGDFVFSGSVFQYADLLREGRLVAAVRRFMDDGRSDDTGRTLHGLLQAGVWPLLPRIVKNGLRPLARRMAGVEAQPHWLRIPREPDVYPDRPRGGSYATEEVTRLLGSGTHAYFLETSERAAAEAGIEVRNPLLDRRLVEFALNIPDDQRRRGPYTKYVLRQALAGELAEPVRTRRTKGDFSHTIVEAIEGLGGARLYDSLRIADAGWVDGAAIAAKYRTMRDAYPAGPDVYGDHVPELWMIAAVELWFRAAFDSTAGSGQ